MKVVKYTLETDGTVPKWVVNGGHFAVLNASASPQDWTIVGKVTDEAPGIAISEQELAQYLEEIGVNFTHPVTNETKDASQIAAEWWQSVMSE
jgi:hypothetical protein